MVPARCGYVVETFGSSGHGSSCAGASSWSSTDARADPGSPGRQGRVPLGYLAANRGRRSGANLLDGTGRRALLPLRTPCQAAALQAQARTRGAADRGAVGSPARLAGRGADRRRDRHHEHRMTPSRRSCSAASRNAWLPARIALSVARREFMADRRGRVDEKRRRELAEVRLSALERIRRRLRLGPRSCRLRSAPPARWSSWRPTGSPATSTSWRHSRRAPISARCSWRTTGSAASSRDDRHCAGTEHRQAVDERCRGRA